MEESSEGKEIMHELGVVFHVIDDVIDIAKENNAEQINTVVLEVGQVSGIVHDYLTDCWNWAASKHEVTKDCRLKIETIEAITHCEECGQNYDTVSHGKICPNCNSEKTYLVQGNEFVIKEIEVAG